jgi:hypothetical protein
VIAEHGEHGQAAKPRPARARWAHRRRPGGPHAPGTHPNRHVHSAHVSPPRMRGRTRPWRNRPLRRGFHPSRCLIPTAAARARAARPGSPGDLPLTRAAGMRRRRRGASKMAPAGPGTSRRRARAGSFGSIVGKCAAAVAGLVDVAHRSFSRNGFQRAPRSERSAAVVMRDRSAQPPTHTTTPVPPPRSPAGPVRSTAPTPTGNERITGASAPTPGRLKITPSPRRSG